MCSNSTVCRQDAVVVMQFIVRGENIITTIYIIITSLPKETLHISICFPLLYITLSLTLSWNATWYNHTLLQNSHYDAKVQWIILSTAFHFPIPCYLPIHYPRPLITYLFTVYGIQHNKNRNNNIGIYIMYSRWLMISKIIIHTAVIDNIHSLMSIAVTN